jgi:hypothetical protein
MGQGKLHVALQSSTGILKSSYSVIQEVNGPYQKDLTLMKVNFYWINLL